MDFNIFSGVRRCGNLFLTALLLIAATVVCLTCLSLSASAVTTMIPNNEPEIPQTTQVQEPPVINPPDLELPYELPPQDRDLMDTTLLGQLGLTGGTTAIDLVILITILSLAPSILIMMTCFTRIVIAFSLLRNAMGVQQTPPNQVMVGLALFLTMFVMSPVISEMNTVAYQPYSEGEYTAMEAVEAASVPLKTWMLKQTSNDSMDFFTALAGDDMYETEEDIVDEVSFTTLIPAFILNEIKLGFQIGFLLFLPFLIIDIVVATILMSMGMIMLPPTMISVPFKIMLFVLADGWTLLIGSLVSGFH